jgi:hypothetical protein
MSLVENYAAERQARLVRLGRRAPDPVPTKKAELRAPRSINAEIYYPQMWFYDLIDPRPLKAHPTVLEIRTIVCDYFKVTPYEVESSRRQGQLVYPRQIAFWLSRTHTPYSYPQIARRFGNRDHTTIMYGSNKIARLIKEDWTVAYDVAHLEAML